VLGDVSALKGA